MNFHWSGFINVARQLHDESEHDAEPESKVRCAVSRFYYGAFCYTRDYMIQNCKFQSSNNYEDHSHIRDFLRSLGKSQLADAATDLQTLHEWRKTCDYRSDKNRSDPTKWSKKASEMASKIIDAVDCYAKERQSHQR